MRSCLKYERPIFPSLSWLSLCEEFSLTRCVSTWFERVSMMVILLNCVTLGMYQPCENIDCSSDRCQILQVQHKRAQNQPLACSNIALSLKGTVCVLLNSALCACVFLFLCNHFISVRLPMDTWTCDSDKKIP